MDADNLYRAIPAVWPDEITQTLLSAAGVRIERILSHGHCSPPDFWYDQAEHEWVLVLQGAARVQFDAETVFLQAGDYVNIPAHVRHRVAWTDPEGVTIWLAVFYAALGSVLLG